MKAVSAGMVLLLAPVGAALAQDASSNYPNKTVRMIIPFAPGGATDVLGRIVAQKLYERWGQVVIADNRVGASGNIGAEFVAKQAPADGYTLLVAGAPHAIRSEEHTSELQSH